MRNVTYLMLLFLFCNSCSTNSDILIFNSSSKLNDSIHSMASNGFKQQEVYLNSQGLKALYKKRNDTLFLVSEDIEYELSQVAWSFSKNRTSSSLNCDKKVIVKSNNVSFSFCYSDVIEFLSSYELKNDVKYSYLINAKTSLQTMEKNNVTNGKYFNDNLISKLIENIPFDSNLDESNELISEIIISEFKYNAFHGYDHFLLDQSQDTIASFSFIDLHSTVDLWKKW